MSAIQTYNSEMSSKDIDTLVQGGIIPKDTPPAQIALFAETSRRHGLDAFKKQIYLVGYAGKYSTIVGIDGMRAKANRTGLLAGCDDAKFNVQPDGSFSTAEQLIRLSKKPATCTITVWKIVGGARCPFTKTVVFNEYCPANSTGKWGVMPFNMIAKCAEAAALRMAFAEETSGLNSEEEIAAIEDVTIKAVEVKRDEAYALQKNRDYCTDELQTLRIDDNTYEALRLEILDAETREELGVVYKKIQSYKAEATDPAKQFNERAAKD